MKKSYAFLFIFCFLSSCQKKQEKNIFRYINHVNKLQFTFVDDKFGEWGGNEKTIIVYRDNFDTQILADYIEKTKKSSKDTLKLSKEIKRIRLNQQQNVLIMKSIDELTEQKLNNHSFPSNSGLHSRVILSDSTFIIEVYPAKQWKNFDNLCKELDN